MARRLGVSRDDVVAAAVRICDRDGVDGLTVAAVASEVGCRPPSVYHHVDGLDGLVRAVTLVAAQQLTQVYEDIVAEKSGIDALRAIVAAGTAWALEHPARYRILLRIVDPERDPEVAAVRNACLLPIQDALAQTGVPPAARPAMLAALIAVMRGVNAGELVAATHAATTGERDEDDKGPYLALDRVTGHRLLIELLLDHIRSAAEQDAVAPAVETGRTQPKS